MRFTRDDEAYEFLLSEFLADVERVSSNIGGLGDPGRVIEMIADDAGIVLVGTILDQARDAWEKGAAMV